MRFIIVLIFIFPFLYSCSSSKKSTDLNPPASEETIKGMPDWFSNPPVDPNYLFASATETSRDMGLAISKATQSARAEIARQLEANVQGLTKNFTEEVGSNEDSELLSQFTEVNKSVTSQLLTGSSVAKKEVMKEGEIYRAYVLAQMPIGAIQEQFLNELKTRQNLYTRFRASEAFQELEREVEKYEKQKSNNQ